LRVATERFDTPSDYDQTRVFHWLRGASAGHQVYIHRFMRIDDAADPTGAADLRDRIEQVDALLEAARQREKQRQSAIKTIRYHLKRMGADRGEDHRHDWARIIEAVEPLIADGVPPSNTELRDLLLPALETMPDLGEVPIGFGLVLRAIDRFLASRPPAPAEASPAAPTAEVRRVADLLRGRAVVLIGGVRRPLAQHALKQAFGLSDLFWIETPEHESLLAIRWSSHGYGEVVRYCDRDGKCLVRLPGGYQPNQVAAQILAQCGERLVQSTASSVAP
jgi:hypothetical protein